MLSMDDCVMKWTLAERLPLNLPTPINPLTKLVLYNINQPHVKGKMFVIPKNRTLNEPNMNYIYMNMIYINCLDSA